MKSRRLLLCIIGVYALLHAPASARGGSLEDFVIPTVAFSRLVVEQGNWCEYRVVEEAMGQRDSSMLYVAIPRTGRPPEPGFFWLEIMGCPLGSDERDTLTVRLLLSREITRFTDRDSLGAYIAAIYIKEGDEPVREGDYDALSQLETGAPGDTARWWPDGDERIATRAGEFACTLFSRMRSFEKRVPASGSTLITTVSGHHRTWFSDEVPLFGMVRYTAERLRDTRLDPPLAGVPVAGARASNTRVELVNFGSGAETVLPPGD